MVPRIPGLDKYRPAAQNRPIDFYVALANKEVRVEDVINGYFHPDLPIPYHSTSWKTSCPFQFEHEDFGFEKQFRVYAETNSCYCFKMHGHMDPVILWQSRLPGLTKRQVAIDLLETFGKNTRTRHWRERFRETLEESWNPFDPEPVKRAFLLMVHGLPDYDRRQFDASVIVDIDTILNEIDRKVPEFETIRDMEIWFKSVKDVFKERYDRV